jgi:dipeptidyl aminopeptidase/acylaminoacyl peptidase
VFLAVAVCAISAVAGTASTASVGTLIVSGGAGTWTMTPHGKRGRLLSHAEFSHMRASPVSSTTFLAATAGRLASDDVELLLIRDGRSQLIEGSAYSPAWAPDGRRFAYVQSGATLECSVWFSSVVEIRSTRSPRSVTRPTGVGACPDPFLDADPTWSRDGSRLAFHRIHPRRPAKNGIYVVRIGRPGVRRLTRGESPAWSPDGRMIAFRRGAALFTYSPRTRATTRRGSLGRSDFYGGLSWSPDGTQIGYSFSTGRGWVSSIFDLRTGKSKRIAAGFRILDWMR